MSTKVKAIVCALFGAFFMTVGVRSGFADFCIDPRISAYCYTFCVPQVDPCDCYSNCMREQIAAYGGKCDTYYPGIDAGPGGPFEEWGFDNVLGWWDPCEDVYRYTCGQFFLKLNPAANEQDCTGNWLLDGACGDEAVEPC